VKSDSDKKELNKFVMPTSIHIDTENRLDSQGSYNFNDGLVLNWRKIVQSAQQSKIRMREEEIEVSEHSLVGLVALETLMHELLHNLSRTKFSSLEKAENYTLLPKLELTKGFTQDGLFVNLDEAVTEQIAQEVFDTYLKRTGNKKLIRDEERILFGAGTYTIERIILQKIIDALSLELHVDRELIWKGFIREYLNGNEAPKALLENIAAELEHDPESRELLDLLRKEQIPENEIAEIEHKIGKLLSQERIGKLVPSILSENFSNTLGID
jgi:hypothetical protein